MTARSTHRNPTSKRTAAATATPKVAASKSAQRIKSTPPKDDELLESLRRLRAENAALQEQVYALRHENEQLAIIFTQHQRTTDDLTLLKNAIIHNVSHELKTPLLHVKAAVANLAEQLGSSSLIDYATTATTRLEGIIRNISLLAGSLEINPAPASFRDSLDQALRSLRRSWEHKDHVERVQTNVADPLPPVLIDAQAIGIVLQLLIDNALKFSREYVEVSARRTRKGVFIQVVDNGIGIPQDELNRIFDAFYQVDSSDSRRFSGAGIGLAIVRVILERHGIGIEVESQQGHGSTFVFTLPYADI
jgi:signal transduction histidine kinase